ncbi:hypothetical protein CVT24_001195 [Panaeolus cyanescens]|uniref:Nephrocystin 3-like N-terminal domain-containing protein n=1 Tax=Panaeolus cyanescens TaxID=181874 RepID=A0A409W6V3_9AGAR|nr:hypothetical protein CVT24_001195 [Panaeolus cyanescens]
MGNALTTGNNKVLVNNPVFNFQAITTPGQNLSPAFEKLCNHICTSAFHNSDEFDETKCHPGTRVSILSLLEQWALTKTLNSDDGITPIIWLHGVAGVGKTAIAKSFAERLQGLGMLAASFFFWRPDPGRSDDRNLVPTLAYQLARSIPPLRSFIEDAIADDPAIFSCASKVQVDTLILKPLRRLMDNSPNLDIYPLPKVLIIDGLDECGGLNRNRVKFQRRAFEIIHSLASHQSLFPFRILVLSRINHHIRILFETPAMRDMSRSILLEKGLAPISDIELYMDAQFKVIKASHPDKDSLSNVWPEKGITKRIAKCARHQFIIAATIMKFIADPDRQPKEQLTMVLEAIHSDLSGKTSSVFAPLYALYRQVIDSVIEESRNAAFEVLSYFFAHNTSSARHIGIRVPDVEVLLGLPPGGLLHCLRGFEAILNLEAPAEGIDGVYFLQFKHSTFVDFMFDRDHAGDCYIDINAAKEKYAIMDIAMFEQGEALSCDDQGFWFYSICNVLNHVPIDSAELATAVWCDKWAKFPKYEAGFLFLQRLGRQAGFHVALLLPTDSQVMDSFCEFLEEKVKPYQDHVLLFTLLLC